MNLEMKGDFGVVGLEFLHDKQDRRINLQNNLMATNDEVVFVRLLQHRYPQKIAREIDGHRLVCKKQKRKKRFQRKLKNPKNESNDKSSLINWVCRK